MQFMEIQNEESVRAPATVRIINGIIPRIGERIGGIDFHSGKVIEVRYDFSDGTVRIITTDQG